MGVQEITAQVCVARLGGLQVGLSDPRGGVSLTQSHRRSPMWSYQLTQKNAHQLAHERMLSTANDQRNANQNYNEVAITS